MKAVLDASFAFSLLASEQASPSVLPVEAAFAAGALELVAPELLWLEFANVLWKGLRKGLRTEAESRAILEDLAVLEVELVGHEGLIDSALELAIETGLTVYDAAYLAVALERQAPLCTLDSRLARAARGKVEVIGA